MLFLRNIMKKTLGILAVGIAGTITLNNIGRNYETGCETYQGFSVSSDADLSFIFDPQPASERQTLSPKYGLGGNSNFRKDLEIGKSYKITIKDPIIGGDKLVSATPCEE